jgi:hypothetical protein
MTESYPSKSITVVDLPESKDLKLKFHYHFFTKDEGVTETGGSISYLTNDDITDEELHRKFPRMVEFSFRPVKIETLEPVANNAITWLSEPENFKYLMRRYAGKIQSEIDIAGTGYSSLILQENDIADATARFLDMSARLRSEDGNTIEKAKIIQKLTKNSVIGNRVLKYFKLPDGDHVKFIENKTGGFIMDETLDDLKGIQHYVQTNSKYVGSLVRRLSANSFHSLSSPASQALEECDEVQEEAKKADGGARLNEDDYLPSILEIFKYRISNANNVKSSSSVIGYVLDKDEVLPDGTLIPKDPILVDGSLTTAGIDPAVKYGATYSYAVRTLALSRFVSVEEETGDLYLISALITSRPSKSVIIECIEHAPPPPPRDLNFIWDYRNKNLLMMWALPIVYARDVKRFQIFRRKKISEPFQLIKEYDFDDSLLRVVRCETIRRSLITKMESPNTTYVDGEFTKESKYIYAICSVDAHDISSNYSEQFELSFDTMKNALVKKHVAYSNAPKPYPNYHLRDEYAESVSSSSLVIDAIKDSNHSRMKIFFDPEYLKVTDRKGNDLELIADGNDGSMYKMQIINIDRQISQIVDIKIDDLRT